MDEQLDTSLFERTSQWDSLFFGRVDNSDACSLLERGQRF
jgi:hypothetical protein